VAVVVVGGQARSVGKTSVVCSLIAELRERQWTAVKLSAHGHSGEIEIHEGDSAGGVKDSARYLTAGAVRSFYITVPESGLEMAMPRLKEILADSRDAMVESTSVLEFLQPELALAVIDPSAAEVKESLQRWGDRFDAVIMAGGIPQEVMLTGLKSKPRFVVHPPEYGSEELNAFVREALGI